MIGRFFLLTVSTLRKKLIFSLLQPQDAILSLVNPDELFFLLNWVYNW